MSLILKAILTADGRGFTAAIGQASNQTDKFSKEIKEKFAQAFGVGSILIGLKKMDDAFQGLVDKSQQIKDTIEQTGLDAGTVQGLSNLGIGDQSTASINTIADAMDRIRKGEDSGAKLAKSFAQLGVSLDDIAKKNPAAIFLQIFDSMKNMEASAANIGAIRDVMGKSGTKLLPASRKGLQSMEANSFKLSETDIDELDRLKDAQTKVGGFWSDLMVGPKKRWGQGKVGLMSYPDSISYILGSVKERSEVNEQNFRMRGMEARLSSTASAKAQKQAQAAADKEAEEKKQKELADIKAKWAEKAKVLTDKLKEQQFNAATDDGKVRMIARETMEIDRQIQALQKLKRERGDDTGELGVGLQQLMLRRGELQRKIPKFGADANAMTSTFTPQVNELQRIGAAVLADPGVDQLKLANRYLASLDSKTVRPEKPTIGGTANFP